MTRTRVVTRDFSSYIRYNPKCGQSNVIMIFHTPIVMRFRLDKLKRDVFVILVIKLVALQLIL